MPTFTAAGYQSLIARNSPDAWLILVTIDHENLPAPVRVVNDSQNVISRGNEWLAYAFDLTLADDSLESQPQISFTLDNVDRFLTDQLRAITSPASFTLEVIRSGDPDVVEMSIEDLILRRVEWDAATINGSIELEDVFSAAFPSAGGTINPRQYPGLF